MFGYIDGKRAGEWGHPLAKKELGRARRSPRHAIPDSQSVKTAEEGEERGFHGGKRIKGRSRHVAIDSQGMLLAVHVCAVNKTDGAEAGAIMIQACQRHPSIESFTADGSYQRQAEEVARAQLGVELYVTAKPKIPKPSRHRLKRGLCAGPLPLVRRAHLRLVWAVSAPLKKNTEKTICSVEAWLWCAMMSLLIRRLAV